MADIWKRLKKSKTGITGLVIVVVFLLIALLAPLIAPEGPYQTNIISSLETPSRETLFGRDSQGRDILSRVIYGSRLSLLISLGSVLVGIFLAVPLGLFAGYFGGKVDTLIRSLADLMLAFPPFLLALSLIAVIGVGMQNVMLSVGISTMPIYIRLVRSEVFKIKKQDYVEAARALGKNDIGIIFYHILRNVFPIIIVQSTLYLGVALLYSSGLGFLGLGIQPPLPEWGSMLGQGRTYIFSAPHLTFFPGLAIFLAILGFNLLGDGLRDALDPHLKGE